MVGDSRYMYPTRYGRAVSFPCAFGGAVPCEMIIKPVRRLILPGITFGSHIRHAVPHTAPCSVVVAQRLQKLLPGHRDDTCITAGDSVHVRTHTCNGTEVLIQAHDTILNPIPNPEAALC